MKVIIRGEDGNHRERESRNGRIYVSTSVRVVWVVKDDSTGLYEEFERLKDAREAHPDAVLVR